MQPTTTTTLAAPPANIALRNDTILGVCQALGEDFGFNPNWLRIAFAAAIYWNPALVIGAYLALGLVVAATRYLVPDRLLPVGQAAPVAPPATAAEPAEPARQGELAAA